MTLTRRGHMETIMSLRDMLKVGNARMIDAENRLTIAESDVTFYRKNLYFIREQIEIHEASLAAIEAAEEAQS